MKIQSYLVCLLLICVTSAKAQEVNPCGTVDYLRSLEKELPGLNDALDRRYIESVEAAKADVLHKTPPLDTLYEITVVFHILYNTPLENIPDSLIYTQMEALNQSFNRENPDTVKTRDIFKPVAGNARIRFKLAEFDPAGNATDGINRVSTTVNSFYNGNSTISNDYVKSSLTGGVDAWDPSSYMNIWVCDLSFNGVPTLLGYAFPPPGANFWTSQSFVQTYRQGVVVNYSTVGRNNPYHTFERFNTAEKTAVHEVGHFLGLRHTWGDPRANQDGCAVDDFLDDTPMERSAARGEFCLLGRNTCQELPNDLPDQIENYMDYSNGPCTNMFTKQQVEVMRFNLHNLRAELPVRTFVEPPHPDFAETKVFPNPTPGIMKIYIKDPEFDEMLDIELIDVLGRVVFSAEQISDYVTTVDATGVTAGYYRIRVVSRLRGELLNTNIIKYD